MSTAYRAAVFTVVLATFAAGTADAKGKQNLNNPTTVGALATENARERANRLPAEASAFAVSPELRAKLRAIEVSSTMPTASADLQMWSEPSTVSMNLSSHVRTRATAGGDAIHRFASGIVSRTSSIAMSLTRSAMRFIGTPYVFGGTSPSGFDCSGYTQHVFAMLGITLPRTADLQYYAGRPIVGGMTTGDLVFFQTYEPGPSHVGIYVGDGRFIHSSSHGVMVSRLDNSYWRARYIGAKRIGAFSRRVVALR